MVMNNPGFSHSEFLQNVLFKKLTDVEHILDVLEACVFENFQVLQEIWPKMNGGFHRRCHEHFPCQHIGFVGFH